MPEDEKARAERIREAESAALFELREAAASGDTEAAHGRADEALCDLLMALGYTEIVNAWRNVDKWYA